MTNKFSSNLGESLNSRSAGAAGNNPSGTPEQSQIPLEATGSSENPSSGIDNSMSQENDPSGSGISTVAQANDSVIKKSNAGRPKIEKAKRRVQLTLTVNPQIKETLDNWATAKPRSATNYLSEYIEEHLDEIINYYDKK